MTPTEADKLALDLERYRDMCSIIGLALGQAVDYCGELGKKPTILLPSRGAIPILTCALALTNYEPLNSARFYPESAASVITGGRINFSRDEEQTHIIQYPFTADVVEKVHTEAEKEANRIRQSCAGAFANLTGMSIKGELDLQWNQFLTNKLLKPSTSFDPKAVTGDLAKIKKDDNRKLILLDTVISGRAASNSTAAFHNLGIDVIPVLATDESEPGNPKIQPKYKHIIEQNVDQNYLYTHHPEDIFVEGPIRVSEDRGSNFLAAVSVFFRGMDKPGFFHGVRDTFSPDFQPSCGIWTFPPDEQPQYQENYKTFLSIVLGKEDPKFLAEMLRDDATRQNLPLKDLEQLTSMKSLPKGTKANETSSHILTVDFPKEYREELVRQFAQEI